MPSSIVTPTPEIALSRDADRGITVHTLDLDGLTPLGTFRSAAEAWRAIDELDAAELAA